MREAVLVFSFFRAVSPLPPLMVGAFVIVAAAASVVVVLDAARTGAVLMPVLTLHLFASASGFGGPARRGYYDMLMTRSGRRVTIGLAHWLMSIGPGVAAWLWIAAVEAAARRAFPVLAFAGGSAAALAAVSMLAWAFTAALPRFAGAIGWLIVLVATMSLWRLDRAFDEGTPALMMAVAALVNPALLIGRALDPAEMLAVTPALALGAAGVAAACTWIARTDYPLEASQ